MKRNAFTLVEMLVVVAIIGVLVAIFLPSTWASREIAKRVICANNLHRLMTGLRGDRVDRKIRTENVDPVFDSAAWPSGAYQFLHAAGIFRCPADERRVVGLHMPDLMYLTGWTNPRTEIPFVPGRLCKARRGVDAEGHTYTEYVIEENLDWPHGATWNGELARYPNYSENDGLWRLYDDIEGCRVLKLMAYTCSLGNGLQYRGEVLWDSLRNHVGDEIVLSKMFTSYGFNDSISLKKRVNDRTIVLLDFCDRVVDPAAPDIASQLSDPDSARHLGNHNVLYADGSVSPQPLGSAHLYPQIHPELWEP